MLQLKTMHNYCADIAQVYIIQYTHMYIWIFHLI